MGVHFGVTGYWHKLPQRAWLGVVEDKHCHLFSVPIPLGSSPRWGLFEAGGMVRGPSAALPLKSQLGDARIRGNFVHVSTSFLVLSVWDTGCHSAGSRGLAAACMASCMAHGFAAYPLDSKR